MIKILVPTDFSVCADNAINFAVQSAKNLPAEIVILHAFEQTGDLYTDYMGVNREFKQTLLGEVTEKLELLKTSIKETEGITVDTCIMMETLSKSILQAVSDKDINMVIMGTWGVGGLKEKFWGSNTTNIIGKCPVPLLVVPYEYEWKKPGKFLLATNHFEKQRKNIFFIFELAAWYKATVDAVVFIDEDNNAGATFLEQAFKIPQYENSLRKQYKEETLAVNSLVGRDFEKSLQDYITRNEIDIIVMITYKHGFMDRLFHPAMTRRMAYHTQIPLLVIPGKPE